MHLTLTVNDTGQITLDHDVLQHLGLQPGETFEVDLLPEATLKVRRPEGKWSGLAGMFKGEFPPLTIDEMNEIIADGWAGKIK